MGHRLSHATGVPRVLVSLRVRFAYRDQVILLRVTLHYSGGVDESKMIVCVLGCTCILVPLLALFCVFVFSVLVTIGVG